jgi:hypothetical protein
MLAPFLYINIEFARLKNKAFLLAFDLIKAV